MALLELNLNPSARELRWFGAMLVAFFALVGGLIYSAGAEAVGRTLWVIGTSLGAVYYMVAPLRGVIYRGWMRVTYPIGWTISHGLLAVIYFLVITPIGLIFRLAGRDPLQRRFTQDASYWEEHRQETPLSRYFNQS